MYAWTINSVTDDEDARSVGVVGPRTATLTSDEIRKKGRKFRLLTDDREVMATGSLVGGDGFEPLDDYGTPYWGCTMIEFWENGWKQL